MLITKKIAVIISAALFCGCAGNYYVRIPYDLSAGNERAAVLRNVYIIVEAPPGSGRSIDLNLKGGSASVLSGGVKIGESFRFEPSRFAAQLARELEDAGAGVAAYRVARGGSAPDPFLSEINPSGILRIKIDVPSLDRAEKERNIVIRDKNGGLREAASKLVFYAAEMRASVSLSSFPDGRIIDGYNDVFSFFGQQTGSGGEIDDWYESNEKNLFAAASQKIAGRFYSPRAIRLRPVFKRNDHKDSKQAWKFARRKKWEEAEKIWSARISSGSGDWRDNFNMGVYAEYRKDYLRASAFFERSKQEAVLAKDVPPVDWNGIVSDISKAQAEIKTGSGTAVNWFGEKIAVLPFSDETSSIDGPVLIRRLVYESLKRGGYGVVPLEETDAVLRGHGFSQGGQLKAAKPADMAGWLGAGRMVFGNITEFSEVPLGVYNKRKVAGGMRLWDVSGRAEIWQAEQSIIRESISTKNAGVNFIFQLARGLWERIRKAPLGYEVDMFVSRCLETLPMRISSEK